ncbi:Dedicator of cytokinesis protein 7, partial [Halocaridina rubra]
IGSTTSQSSFISTVVGGNRSAFTTLSNAFRQQHFLIGLVLSDLATALEINNSSINARAVNTVRNLLSSHDTDDRYLEPEIRARVAALYLPLINIVIDALPQLHTFASPKNRYLISSLNDDGDGGSSHIHQNVALAIAGSSVYANKESDYDVIQGQQSRKCPLSSTTTRNLLMCLLWILRNVDDVTFRHTLSDLPHNRLHQLLDVLYIAVSCFEYKGKKISHRSGSSNARNKADMKRLEEFIMGQHSARSEMMLRRRERNPPSPSGTGERLRWRKETFHWRNHHQDTEHSVHSEIDQDSQVEGHLAAEANMVILDSLENVVQVVTNADHLQGLLTVVFGVLLHALASNQSTITLTNMFNTQRALVAKASII